MIRVIYRDGSEDLVTQKFLDKPLGYKTIHFQLSHCSKYTAIPHRDSTNSRARTIPTAHLQVAYQPPSIQSAIPSAVRYGRVVL